MVYACYRDVLFNLVGLVVLERSILRQRSKAAAQK